MNKKAILLNNQANLFTQDGKYKKAISYYKKAIALDSSNYTYFFNQAQTYLLSGEIENALDSIKEAYSLSPKEESVLESYIDLLIKNKNLEEAEAYCKLALSQNKENSHFWNLMGVINFQNQNYEKAKDSFSKALEIQSDFKEAKENLKDCLEII